ncbi:hypothetical protein HCA50_07425 [Listeria innocua]|uniref:toxin Cry1Ac domain D-VI-related protein n=1 Tax=Listeria TaxID=1637 RepID=UPI0011EABEE9|nr:MULTISPECIES: toxin Cry1Ac domain D-VI-related protein [Listeria]EBF5204145.1 hypothetical protein [Listeria monocytogenes]MBC1903358.1 hypothetical protein [Listeria innocua]TYV05656.1 hypothetical protein FZ054_07090 [Listeria monocytogenes]
MDKKRKFIIGVSIAIGLVILGGGALGFRYHSVKAEEKKQAEAQQAQTKKLQQTIQTYQKEVNSWYTDDKKEGLQKATTEKEIIAMESQLEKLEGKEMSVDTAAKLNTLVMDVGYARSMLDAQTKVASLFDGTGALVENAQLEAAEKAVNKLKETKPAFVKAQQKRLTEAKNQAKAIEEATKAVNALYTNDKRETVQSNVTQANYTTAKTKVASIKQAKAKKTLSDALAKVEAVLQKQKEVAQQQATEQAANTNDNQATNDAATSNGGNKTASSHSQAGSDSSNGSSSSQAGKSSASSANGGTKSSASSGKSKGSSGSSKASGGSSKSGGWYSKYDDLKPGDSWTGESTDQGVMESDGGRTWGTGTW